MSRRQLRLAGAIALVMGATGGAGAWVTHARAQAAAEKPAVKRTVLMRTDASVPGREFVMATTELPPGSTEGRHTHAADLFAFVQEGTATLEVDGEPTKNLKPGDYFTIPQGKVHVGYNQTGSTCRVAVVLFAEKGKPLTTPAP
jgi:quercetin dioxygenase-like cupin family protein